MSDVKEAVTEIFSGPKSDAGEDEGVLSQIKQFFVDINEAMKNKTVAFDVFEKNLLFLKGFFLVLFIILALVNYFSYKTVGLISTKPGLFAVESMIFGLSGVVPFVLLCYLRNQVYSLKKIVILSAVLFVVFFILNYLLELGGVYAATFYPVTTDETAAETVVEQDENKVPYSDKLKTSLSRTSDIVTAGLIIGSLCALLFSACFVQDFSPSYTHFKNLNPSIVFFVEMLLFGIISAVPIFFMAFNRNALSSNTAEEFFLIVAKFSVLHCMLQVSGFYRHIFSKTS